MIRVLQCVNNMHRAGLETMLMNYYRNIDRSRIQFDFLTHRPDRSDYDDEIEALGGKIYRAPRLYPQNYPAYFSYMKQFWKEHPEYRIIHSHIDAMSYLPLLSAKKAGIPVRIAHSHNTSIDRDFKYILKQYFRSRLPGTATHFCACGQEAGHFLFGKRDFTFLPNAIDPACFSFDAQMREKKRKELGVAQNFVVGHVGRISYQKNHEFLVEIFAEIRKRESSARLLLVGVGEQEAQVRAKIASLGITEQVCFLGNRSDVNELYQAMDVFVLPSRFEGVPVVGIEAQFAGLPCVFSNKVPKEVKFAENSQFISPEQSPAFWAEQVLQTRNAPRTAVSEAVYDIKNAHSILEDYYFDLAACYRQD